MKILSLCAHTQVAANYSSSLEHEDILRDFICISYFLFICSCDKWVNSTVLLSYLLLYLNTLKIHLHTMT